eukprot:scaffold5169_cov172-Amphora_coffeaeformis.AAC.33
MDRKRVVKVEARTNNVISRQRRLVDLFIFRALSRFFSFSRPKLDFWLAAMNAERAKEGRKNDGLDFWGRTSRKFQEVHHHDIHDNTLISTISFAFVKKPDLSLVAPFTSSHIMTNQQRSPSSFRKRPTLRPSPVSSVGDILPPAVATHAEALHRKQSQPWRKLFWNGLPADWTGHFVSVDLSARWRRHLVWAKSDAKQLLQVVTARFTSTTVFLTLLVSAELGTFFSPSRPVEEVRTALENDAFDTLDFWVAIALSVGIFCAVAALFANFTAWSIFVVLSPENAALILRSSVGLYAAQLPNRLVIASIYTFFVWIVLFWFKLLPLAAAIILGSAGTLLLVHLASTYSAMGEIILATSAMSASTVLEKGDEERLSPAELYKVLLLEHDLAKRAKIPIMKQYRMDYFNTVRESLMAEVIEQGEAQPTDTTPSPTPPQAPELSRESSADNGFGNTSVPSGSF